VAAPDPHPGAQGDPAVLAERRARRAELAEEELRRRLADAERRVAELEQAEHDAQALRVRLAQRSRRDAALASVIAQAAAATRATPRPTRRRPSARA